MHRETEPTQRLFFALWPDDTLRAALAEAARHSTRKPITDDRLHMTLIFLGSRTDTQRQCFSQAASTIQVEAFELTLDYLGAWPRRGIRWLGTTRIPDALVLLVSELNRVLAPCGYEAEKRPFVPHITLSRKERNPQPQASMESVCWPVSEFVLVESVGGPEGTHYQPLERWPLLQKTA